MNRIVHFEIMADDIQRAAQFYQAVFGWQFEDYSQYTNAEYWGVITGEEGVPGINGGLMKRSATLTHGHQEVNAFICTVQVDDFDKYAARVIQAGGSVIKEKYALPGMAWQGYFTDPEGNQFGLHQADENAQ